MESDHTRDGVLGLCLLHADYHDLESDCWDTMTEFWVREAEGSYGTDWDTVRRRAKDRYDFEVERAMLNQVSREALGR